MNNDIKNDIENVIKNDESYHDCEIDYILIRDNDIYAVASNYDLYIEFDYEKGALPKDFRSIGEWAYDFDSYFFDYLERGYKIAYISDDSHYNLWTTIGEQYLYEKMDENLGIRKYFEYCDHSNITKEYLKNRCNYQYVDIMKYYDYGLKFIRRGFRNDEPVALVEKHTTYKHEYIIGINYIIKDNKIMWGNGYYYDKDIEKANRDFSKLLVGGNLVDTFSEDDKTFDNGKIINHGVRERIINDNSKEVQAVALIEQTTKTGKDYLVAINTKINNNSIEYEYASHFGNDKATARLYYNKVLDNNFKSKKRSEIER